jgi:hypothetical protein
MRGFAMNKRIAVPETRAAVALRKLKTGEFKTFREASDYVISEEAYEKMIPDNTREWVVA